VPPEIIVVQLRVFGSSRSGVADFEKTVQMYQQYPEIIDYFFL
jgi:ribitol-5-phosphate 2-dehydrogenase